MVSIHPMAQAAPELRPVLLPPPSELRDYRQAPPCPVCSLFYMTKLPQEYWYQIASVPASMRGTCFLKAWLTNVLLYI